MLLTQIILPTFEEKLSYKTGPEGYGVESPVVV